MGGYIFAKKFFTKTGEKYFSFITTFFTQSGFWVKFKQLSSFEKEKKFLTETKSTLMMLHMDECSTWDLQDLKNVSISFFLSTILA